jgi:hypothetical protein
MALTRQEIAAGASRMRSSKARRRRFAKYAAEMAAAPKDIEFTVQHMLAETLMDLDWEVHIP